MYFQAFHTFSKPTGSIYLDLVRASMGKWLAGLHFEWQEVLVASEWQA